MEATATNGHQTQPAPRNRLFLVSSPRTASNLLVKVLALAQQPNALINERGGYVLWNAFMSANLDGRLFKPLNQWTAADKAKLREDSQRCLNELEESSAKAEQEGKMFVTKEHAGWFMKMSAIQEYVNSKDTVNDEPPPALDYPIAYGSSDKMGFSPNNKTMFADAYLRTWQAAFIIRHPALVFPSAQRSLGKLLKDTMEGDILEKSISINMTFRWTRALFDFFQEQGDKPPAVLDAHDLINNPLVVAKYSKLIGLDPTQLQFEWDTQARKETKGHNEMTEEERRDYMEAFMLATLRNSSGIDKNKAPENIDIAVEASKWKEEFGEDIASMLEKAVVEAMPDYEYLKARRVSVEDGEILC
ncbi:hypothetical protein BGW36DRAFT_361870 [Talaromyces proteolyticus]|uniref:Uncharacterized protein n=1 Tax=Talaromyces proteolyticus TaxID=1131652 RepID=A0AAD4KL30_9EURO|nr:uncharacterized protein BGW36DRAFT_361870 [Talaromyces proteolyticus]KAH8694047.1 hypothetical protein BGW36DRAFT_361870 [Talaromyces proteolyticus]